LFDLEEGWLVEQLTPVVRHLIVCENVRPDSANPRRITVEGLLHTIYALDDQPYPLRFRRFCVFVQMTASRNSIAESWIEVRQADSNQLVIETSRRHLPTSSNPLDVLGVNFQLLDCLFPAAGLYWVQFWYDDNMLGRQPLLLR